MCNNLWPKNQKISIMNWTMFLIIFTELIEKAFYRRVLPSATKKLFYSCCKLLCKNCSVNNREVSIETSVRGEWYAHKRRGWIAEKGNNQFVSWSQRVDIAILLCQCMHSRMIIYATEWIALTIDTIFTLVRWKHFRLFNPLSYAALYVVLIRINC